MNSQCLNLFALGEEIFGKAEHFQTLEFETLELDWKLKIVN